jgi:hypothetical protein
MTKRFLAWGEILLVVLIALAPLTGTFPYRYNIFLSYEGAYRLYLGQVPYRDFGMPLGYMYWVVPFLSFKLFGPYLLSLVKGQVFLNILAGISFLSIMKNLSVKPAIRFLSLLVFLFSYSFTNYWPWYNHTVIVYELAAIAFLLHYLFAPVTRWRIASLMFAALFVFCSFFTKQDGGGLAFLICISLLAADYVYTRNLRGIILFLLATFFFGLLFILPVRGASFSYWFNHGQPPHTARFSAYDIIAEFFNASQWIKFYLLAVLLIVGIFIHRNLKPNRLQTVFAVLTMGILGEAAILQVTSYVPPDNNIFFHSFAFAFIASAATHQTELGLRQWKIIALLSVAILAWWSPNYWRYLDGTAKKILGYKPPKPGVVNKNTYLIATPDSTDVPMNEWRALPLRSFQGMLLPGPTVDGVERLLKDSVWRKKDAKVLNMSELTPLAYEVPFSLETGERYPLWFHKGVGMFDQQSEMFRDRIRKHYYDLVIFEYIPYLNNFYPFDVRDELRKEYRLTDKFTAPRKPSNQAWVEIYKP